MRLSGELRIKTTENLVVWLLATRPGIHLHGAERYDNWRQWHMVIFLPRHYFIFAHRS
jgi:hypothetical protein